jgi:hypothetical protein
VFQLLTPGPRNVYSGMFPRFATVIAGQPLAVQSSGFIRTGMAYAVVLKYSSNVRAPSSRFGLPTIRGRTPSPPPAKLIEGKFPC